MWCANCQDDVATEISQDGQSLNCTTCGDVVREVFAPNLHPETKSARELLEKWAEEQNQQTGDSLETDVSESESSESEVVESESTPDSMFPLAEESDQEETKETIDEQSSTEESRLNIRIDDSHETEYLRHGSRRSRSRRLIPRTPVADNQESQKADIDANVDQLDDASDTIRRDKVEQHGSHTMPPPHFDMETARRKARTRPGRAESIWGQLLAYLGVGVLTIGSVFVLWGYFGMIEQYASTGWLLSTAGQMLLLLGVVTLVSGGMQQTQHEVSERIEYLGGRMIRIEQSTEQILNGPHFLRSRTRAEVAATDTENNENREV